jgi:hypothetical protein
MASLLLVDLGEDVRVLEEEVLLGKIGKGHRSGGSVCRRCAGPGDKSCMKELRAPGRHPALVRVGLLEAHDAKRAKLESPTRPSRRGRGPRLRRRDQKRTSSPTLIELPPQPGRRTRSPATTEQGCSLPACWVRHERARRKRGKGGKAIGQLPASSFGLALQSSLGPSALN